MDGKFWNNGYGNVGGFNAQNGMNMNNSYANNMFSNQSQGFSNTPRQNMIPGRVVHSEEEIRPNEVPMDGISTFIQQDLSRVYLKTWGNDGGIHTNVYELVNPGVSEKTSDQNEKLDVILERLDQIDNKIGSRPIYKNNKNYSKGGSRHESTNTNAIRNESDQK